MGELQQEDPKKPDEKPDREDISHPIFNKMDNNSESTDGKINDAPVNDEGQQAEQIETIKDQPADDVAESSRVDNSQGVNAANGNSEKISATKNSEDTGKEKTIPDERVESLQGNNTVASGSGTIAINAVNSSVTISYRTIEQALNEGDAKRKSDETGTLLFSPLDEKDLIKYEDVFVEPENYKNSLQILYKETNERLFFVQGPENSGKFIAAVNIGLDICQQQNIGEKNFFSHVGKNINIRSLIAFLESSKDQTQSIYIIRDIFEHGLSLSDFSDMVLSVLNKFLRSNNNYLILTTTRSRDDLEYIKSHIISSQVSETQLAECFIKHLRYGERQESIRPVPTSIISLINNSIDEINKGFRNPNQIDYFFDQISRDEWQITVSENVENEEKELFELGEIENIPRLKEALLKLAHRARRYGFPGQESTKLWFEGLHENIKLFALLAVILQGFKFDMIEEIYEKAVTHLIESNVGAIEHQASFGRNKILTAIHARLEDDSFLVFDNQAYILEIRRQIDNRHLLLWPLVNLFTEYIYGYTAREHWMLRRELGAAIGRVGIYGYGKLEIILDTLAQHEESGVVASAGYALAEICNLDSKHYPYVVNVIKRWADSGNPDLMWAAGASIWRVYDSLMRILKNEKSSSPLFQKTDETIQLIYKCLTELASEVNVFSDEIRRAILSKLRQIVFETVANDPNLMLTVKEAEEMEKQLTLWTLNNIGSILHAIRQMLWLNPSDIVKLVENWINSNQTNNANNANLKSLGLLSANELFKKASDTKQQRFYELNIPLINLAAPLLVKGDQDSIELMMGTFNNWMSKADLAEQVERLIIPIVNRLDAHELHRFRDGIINYWLTKNVKYAHQLGKSLIGRSYAIQGSPLGLFTNEGAFLLWDTSLAGRKDHVDKVARNLYIRINARQNVELYPLGQTQRVSFSNSYPSIEDLQLALNHSPLIYPIVNPEKDTRINFIIAIVHDQILDIEDLEISIIKEKCLFVRLKGVPEEPSYDIPIDRWIERDNYLALEQFLDSMIASNLVRTEEETLWNQIKLFTNGDKSIINISNLLNNWTELIDIPSSLQFNGTKIDLAQIISCSLVWLAHQDLNSCLQLLESWILTQPLEASKSRPSRQILGISGGRLILNILAQSQNVDAARFFQIIPFVELLVKQGNWESQRVVLIAMKNWIKTEENYQAIFHRKRATTNVESDVGNSESILNTIVQYVPQSNHADLLDIMEKWLQEKESNPYLKRAAKQIKTKVLLGRNVGIFDFSDLESSVINSIQNGTGLPEGRKYCLIIFNAFNSDQNIADIAVETCLTLSKGSDYYPIICRVGQKMPIAIGKQEISRDNLLRKQMYQLPSIVGPLLDNLHVQQFSFGIIFGPNDFHDKDDWHENWKKVLSFQYPLIDTSIAGWPPQIEEKSISEHQTRALQITKFITDRVKG